MNDHERIRTSVAAFNDDLPPTFVQEVAQNTPHIVGWLRRAQFSSDDTRSLTMRMGLLVWGEDGPVWHTVNAYYTRPPQILP